MKVKALENGFDLTEGKIYDVLVEHDSVYELMCDTGRFCRPKHFFEIVESPVGDYNSLFNRFEKNCENENVPNPFRYIQYYELVELNSLLDKIILFVDNNGEDRLEELEHGEDIIKLYHLIHALYDRDI